MSKFFARYSLYELVIMAVMAALGIALKPILVPLAHIVCGPLMIPAGALAGGLYMMWIIIGYGFVKKPGTALIICIIQALLVLFTGVVGSHGIMSLMTYILPGAAVELLLLLIHHRCCCIGCCALAGIAANVVGTAAVNVVFFKAPGVYLILVLAVAALSGMVGGLISWQLIQLFQKYNLIKIKGEKNQWKED